MISIKHLITIGLLLLLGLAAFSQPICGFDIVHKRKMSADPIYRQHVLANEASIRRYIQQHPLLPGKTATAGQNTPLGQNSPSPTPLSGPPYTIPVVVHVIHTGGAVGTIYNPPDAQILKAIAYLNAVYNGTEPGTLGAGDLQIQFALAQRDPNCNPTNGINRVDGSGVAGYVSGGVQAQQQVTGTADTNVKNLIRWNTSQYYNIWIVNKIDGNDGTGAGSFIAGFAYFPGSPVNEDGIVMLATQMDSGQKTLPHEIGHAFNLYHPFQSSDPTNMSCAPNGNCNIDGDQICDTDPITEPLNFVCRTGSNNPCTGTPYTINTENNYMNYTLCYSLFTPDQKIRMLASAAVAPRLSLTTSQGAMAPGAGSSPCTIPKIDFELSGDQVTEATAATTATCRPYKDYNYNMVIGLPPTAAATATLNISSGTATQGLDYDITTNGNFTTPSLSLTFPPGSTTSQPFTIRVYDDASVNGTRNVILGFTVNAGGGNAVPGDGRPSFNMIIDDNDVAPSGPHSVSSTIGSLAGYLPGPFDSVTSNKIQFIYYASELSAAGITPGNINGLSLNIGKFSGSAFVYQGTTIKMGLTAQSTLFNGSFLSDAAFTTVFSANYTTTNGWNNFNFSTPFTWDGTSNVVVEICYDNGASKDQEDICQGYNDGTSNYTYFYEYGKNCGMPLDFGVTPFTSYKPVIQFTYMAPGTTVQTALNASGTQYLGPNADVYFYDQASQQLMARIQNLSSFNYGCTQVLIDRQGSSATQFWNTNTSNYLMDKTFHVIPTTNDPAGSYNITLYYTQAEINGWQTATAQTLSNIQLVKVTGQISSVTPAAPAGGGTMVTGAPAISSLGTNTGLTYNFTTGFSGFGAGIPGSSPLPVSLLSFDGHLQDNTVHLNWATAQEEDSKLFGVERSYDGRSFVNIGNVPAAGNSSTLRSYAFTDPSIAQTNNYYRLRQVDLDDHFVYSKIVVVNNLPGTPAGAFTILSNPFAGDLDILFGPEPVGKVDARLLDITGKELLRRSGQQSGLSRMRIDLSGTPLSAGIYLLELSFNGNTYTQKVIKE